MKFAKLLPVALLLIGAPSVFAQSTQDDLAREAANPIANLMSIPIQNNVDWNANEGNKWKVPFGAGGGKLMFWGKLPVNLQTQAYYYVESPEYGPEWQWRVQFQFFLPVPGSG